MLTDDDVLEGLQSHAEEMSARQPEYRAYRSAYKSRYWRDQRSGALDHDGEEDDSLPVKVEVNQVWPFVTSQVSNLMYRGPAVSASLPAVFDAEPGRNRNLVGLPERVSALCTDWLRRSHVRNQANEAYRLALMYDASAFKLHLKERGDVVSRIRVQAIPRWEAVWDPFARTPEQLAYIGHLRWELLQDAREIVGDPLEGADLSRLPDSLEGTTAGYGRSRAYAGYVQIYELYDLIAGEQRFYHVTGGTHGRSSLAIKRVGEVAPIPYEYPNGDPGVPIVPVILSPVPGYPLQGISAVRRIYHLNAEMNLTLSIVANAMRRDAARVYLYLKEAGVSEETLRQIQEAKDLALIGIDGPNQNRDLSRIFHALQAPNMPSSLAEYRQFLYEGRQDTQAASDIQQGRQGQYLTATEATYLASYGEQANNDLQAQMQDALGRVLQLFLAAVAGEGKAVNVRQGMELARLDPKDLLLPWELALSDSSSTPLKEQQRKAEFLQLQRVLVELAQLASASPDPGPDGSPPVPAPLRKMAQRMIAHIVKLWQLPEELGWEQLSIAGGPSDSRAERGRAALERLASAGPLPDNPAAVLNPEVL